MVTHIRIDVMSHEGVFILGETHSITFTAEGLLEVPVRLGVNPTSMLCFPTKEEAMDTTNRGDPFTAVCKIFTPGAGADIMSVLMKTGYSVSESGTAQLWVRAEGNNSCPLSNSVNGETGFPSEEPSTQMSREHLPAEVKARMKSLCNEICPRSGDGVMLTERSQTGVKRPAWCLDEVMRILGEEFDESLLKNARLRARKYMANCSTTFKRLRSYSPEVWATMGESEREKSTLLLQEFEMSAKVWRLGAYGFIWEGGKLRRRPTAKELTDFQTRMCLKQTKPIETHQ